MATKTVLIVHDDADLVGSLRAALAEQSPDIELVNALSGPRALGMMAQAVPDVLVVDAELAGVDGYAFTRQVKTAPATAQVPVIIVSLDPNEVSALKARQVGAAAHLPSTGPVGPARGQDRRAGVRGAARCAAAAQPRHRRPPAAAYPPPRRARVGAVVAPASVSAPSWRAIRRGARSRRPSYGAPQPVPASGELRDHRGAGGASAACCRGLRSPPRQRPSRRQRAPHRRPAAADARARRLGPALTVGSAPGIRQRGELAAGREHDSRSLRATRWR